MSEVLIVGPGRVGRALALAHARGGDSVRLLGRHTGAWQPWAQSEGVVPVLAGGPRLPQAATVLFAVPDAQLSAAASHLAVQFHVPVRCLVAHTSGLHDLRPLRPLQRAGACVAALHPIMPFVEPHRDLLTLQRSVVTLLAGLNAERLARKTVSVWGARVVPLEPSVDRRRYHLGLSLAANHLVGVLAWAEDLLRPALGREAHRVVSDLGAAALEQSCSVGPEEALTGPVVRGDAEVVAAHLRALRGREREAYRGMLEPVIALAERSGRLARKDARALRELAAPAREREREREKEALG